MKNKIILINYNGLSTELFSLMPDNGLATLASFLMTHGYEPLILDYVTAGMFRSFFTEKTKGIIKEIYRLNEHLYEDKAIKKMNDLKVVFNEIIKEKEYKIAEELIRYIKKFNSPLVGFKLWEGAGFHGSVRIAEEIKRQVPQVITVAGGPHADIYDTDILAYTHGFDFLIYGEGEIALSELTAYAGGKKNLKSVPNLIYRDGTDVKKNPLRFIDNIEEIPPPVYDEEIYPAMKGDEKIKTFLIEESRGCPNRCKFCIHPIKSGSVWRHKHPKRVVDEIEKSSSLTVRLTGSNPPPGLLTSISEEILARHMSINYSTFGHARNFPSENYNLMRKAGCRAMAFGIESGSQYILDTSIGKNIAAEQAKSALKASKEAGIYTIASVIVPSPHDTEETIKETLRFLLDAMPDSVTAQFAILTPHTEWWENPEKYAFHFKDREELRKKLMLRNPPTLLPAPLWERIHYKLNNMSDRDIIKTTGNFIRAIQSHGITHGMSDFHTILAISGKKDIKDLKEKSEKAFIEGDIEQITDIVSGINEHILVNHNL
ncbi:MAG: radical SAM protein [Candidatus Eremiobacterota bacterium]